MRNAVTLRWRFAQLCLACQVLLDNDAAAVAFDSGWLSVAAFGAVHLLTGDRDLARRCQRIVSDCERQTFCCFGFLACLDAGTLQRLHVSVSFRSAQVTLDMN